MSLPWPLRTASSFAASLGQLLSRIMLLRTGCSRTSASFASRPAILSLHANIRIHQLCLCRGSRAHLASRCTELPAAPTTLFCHVKNPFPRSHAGVRGDHRPNTLLRRCVRGSGRHGRGCPLWGLCRSPRHGRHSTLTAPLHSHSCACRGGGSRAASPVRAKRKSCTRVLLPRRAGGGRDAPADSSASSSL